MRSKSRKSSFNNDVKHSNKIRESSRIGIYCTLRSRSADARPQSTSIIDLTKANHNKTDLLKLYTASKKLKYLIRSNTDTNISYKKLNKNLNINYGLTNNLSSETIKNSCDLYEFSDDDELKQNNIELINSILLEKVEKRLIEFTRSSLRQTLRLSNNNIKKSNNNYYPYCTLRKIQKNKNLNNSNIKNNLNNIDNNEYKDSIEVYNILSELDTILDDYSKQEIESSCDLTDYNSLEFVENYLFELDEYLEEIDLISLNSFIDNENLQSKKNIQKSSTLPKKLKLLLNKYKQEKYGTNNIDIDYKNDINDENIEIIKYGNPLRRTIADLRSKQESPIKLNTNLKDSLRHTLKKSWQRHSMRKASLVELPNSKDIQPIQSTSQTSTDYILSNLNKNEFTNQKNNNLIESSSDENLFESSVKNIQKNCLNSSISNSDNIQIKNSNLNSSIETTQESQCLLNVNNSNERILTHVDIINDIINNTTVNLNQHRPRQLGRRAEGQQRILSIMADTNEINTQRILCNNERPLSAPAAIINPTITTQQELEISNGTNRFIGSETSSIGSSRNPSPVSIISSTGSSSMVSGGVVDHQHQQRENISPQRIPTPIPNEILTSRINRNDEDNSQWPHSFSRILALLCCTLGLFNISRFSILTIHYGGNFLLQFFILSIIFGIPMFWLQMCLGAKIKCGPISMWKISPICKGIGISLMLGQFIIALYSTVSLAWIITYFKDSFVIKNDKYLWEEPYLFFRGRNDYSSNNLTETVADYFNGVVLRRLHLRMGKRPEYDGVLFELAFNLSFIWLSVFIVLCKGLKSFGKIVLGLTILPLVLLATVSCKLLYIIDFSSVKDIFTANDFEDFLINPKSWTAAAQETFLTWSILGPSVLSMSSKSTEKSEHKTILRRDAILVVLLTLLGLTMAAIFGYACIQILQNYNYIYIPGSFENLDSYVFLYSLKSSIRTDLFGIPTKWLPHYSSFMGETYRRQTIIAFKETGYQSLRLITELFPATLAVATQNLLSPIWSILTYLMFFLFGLAQLCAMWKPISSILGNSTSCVLLSCMTGLLLGIPFATEMGLTIIHYLDIVIGGSWWLLILWTLQILAIFLIRGRPYSADILVNDLHMTGSMSAFLALSWNVLLPIGLITLSIIEYKISLTYQFFNWRGKSYFYLWTRKIAALLQITFLLLVPITAIIQIYRYLTKGPPDFLDRIQNLYRPSQLSQQQNHRTHSNINRQIHTIRNGNNGTTLSNIESQIGQDDAPPKYTPPPSYSTATGARIAKMLRQSIRRSVRRILGESSRPRLPLQNDFTIHHDPNPPPEYSTNPSGELTNNNNDCNEIGPKILFNSLTQRTLSLEQRDRTSIINNIEENTTRNHNINSFNGFDVTQILRPSNRHERSISALATCVDNVLRTSTLKNKNSRSDDNLVLNAAPLGLSSTIVNVDDTSTNYNEDSSVI